MPCFTHAGKVSAEPYFGVDKAASRYTRSSVSTDHDAELAVSLVGFKEACRSSIVSVGSRNLLNLYQIPYSCYQRRLSGAAPLNGVWV